VSSAAYAAIVKANERAQALARDKGRQTFALEVLESWPGCVECGHKITALFVATPGRTHKCACPGVTWSYSYAVGLGASPWQRHEPDPGLDR
jgi:hypothetical protein